MKTQKSPVKQRGKAAAARKKASPARWPAARITRRASAADIIGRAANADPAAGQVPPKWRFYHGVLLALQNRLLLERGDLRLAAAEPLESHSLDEADSATDQFDHDLALTQLAAEQDALCAVSEALGRIRDGTYGVCLETGLRIPVARLRAVPWARFTREVEERLEQKGVVPRAHLNKAGTVRIDGEASLAPEGASDERDEG